MLKLKKKKSTMWNGNNMGTSSAVWIVASHPHIEIWSSGKWGWNATDTSGLARKSIVLGAEDRKSCLESVEAFIAKIEEEKNAVVAHFKIDWHHGWANPPSLIATTNTPIKFDCNEPVWTMQDNGVVWAEKSGFISYIYMGNGMVTGNSGFRGFGGRLMERVLKDGTKIQSNDAWSSRAECLDFPTCEVNLNNSSGVAMRREQFEKIVNDLGAFVVGDDISSDPLQKKKPTIN